MWYVCGYVWGLLFGVCWWWGMERGRRGERGREGEGSAWLCLCLCLCSPSLPTHTHTRCMQPHPHKHTSTQMHGLGCTLLPPQHPTHPQGRREGGREYSTKPSSHAAQAHHTPLHAINNENKAGKGKRKKRTGVGNEEMPLGIHMLLLFIFCSFLIHILFFHPHTLFTFLPHLFSFLYSFHFSFLYPMP